MTATLPRGASTSSPGRFAFLRRPGWIGAIVGALAFTAACWLILAPWQFARSAQNDATNAQVNAALHDAAVPVRQYLSTTAQPSGESTYKLVTATGTFDTDHVTYVRLRQDSQGNPVSEVVLPMRLTDGSVLLVDRGYQSFGDIKANVPLPPVPTGVVTVTGRVQADQTDPSNRQPRYEAGLHQAWAVNSTALAGMDGTAGANGKVLLGYIQLAAPSPGVLQEIGMPQTSVGPYFSYALQWCAFGGMALLAIAYFIFREATDPRGPDERDVAYPERSSYPAEIAEATAPAGAVSSVPAVAESPPPSPDPGPGRRKARRAARDGFDRSQLFD
ncbi:Cytochrome oxidase assembly protein ShyY1 [Nakamurella panacisegetis]|uniref:SURF1-like protein n=1 Tax=Nakamurella panacisegetis TaxID=1090615 RepID=A0A1H0QZS1_9ACTN|nr:SURF1 family cytochrome oxidase biogenesis protein [Nakamurella panacisegetis]SDP22429.1 Cytochrome oxidase assembly protein ShyY1 [Nakamurella panacisegetis]